MASQGTSGSGGSRVWDPKMMFDATPAEQRAVEQRAKMRAQLKAEWQKKVTNPHRGVGGYIFDPAVQRFLSMRATGWHTFKPTPKNFAWSVAFGFGPILFFWYLIDKDVKKKESMYRSGQIAYKDRDWKFIN